MVPGELAVSPSELPTLDRLEVCESRGGRVKVAIMILFSRYWCGPRFGVDTPREYPGRIGRASEVGGFELIGFTGSVLARGIGSGSRNRTIGGADLRLRFAPTDLDGFRFDFVGDCLRPPVETSLLDDDALGWLRDDRLELRVDVGVVLLLESGGRDPLVVTLRRIM